MCSFSSQPKHHVVLFPFMSKGHTIPILHLARFLLRRNLSVTIITTPANRAFIAQYLKHTTTSIIDLPFPTQEDIPAGVESTEKLPSMSLFYNFALATKHMQPDFERVLHTLPRVSFMVSDGFLWWTLESASKYGIPRFVFYGMSNHAGAIYREVAVSGILRDPESPDEPVAVPRFPWVRVIKNDFDKDFLNPDTQSLVFQFHMNIFLATSNSYGMIANSFYELEPVFVDYLNSETKPKVWCIGPLCLADEPVGSNVEKPSPWIEWLDKKFEEGSSVLYVAFGSQAEISEAQLGEIAVGLEESKVNFLWVCRKGRLMEGFEERVKGRGMVVSGWVDQREILMHPSIKGFLSHCGWNSVVESICAGVPILAWPMMAEQPLNARMVGEEIKTGLSVEICGDRFVKSKVLEGTVRELMEGEKGEEARKTVKEVADMARKAVEEGGSSWRTLERLIEEVCKIDTGEC